VRTRSRHSTSRPIGGDRRILAFLSDLLTRSTIVQASGKGERRGRPGPSRAAGKAPSRAGQGLRPRRCGQRRPVVCRRHSGGTGPRAAAPCRPRSGA
jgi:hypothetical protein